MKTIFLIHIAVTLIMVGVIWIVQLVHYPLFANVGADEFTRYEQAHMWRISLIVIPVMSVELITALWLALMPPDGISQPALWVSAGLVIALWGVTVFVNAPQHGILSSGFDAATHAALVQTNWIRTLLWSARGGLLLWLLWKLIHTA